MAVQVHLNGEAVDRLRQLGLDVALVGRVLRAANAEARTCTPMDPPNLGGMLRWGRTNRFLREELYPRGWSFDNGRNLPRTISPSADLAIVATSGDESTGWAAATPSTKYAKGMVTVEAVRLNEQLTLDYIGVDLAEAVRSDVKITTWVLLYHVDDEFVRAELSLPDSISASGYISSWRERIILPTFTWDDGDAPGQTPDADGDDGFDVQVARR